MSSAGGWSKRFAKRRLRRWAYRTPTRRRKSRRCCRDHRAGRGRSADTDRRGVNRCRSPRATPPSRFAGAADGADDPDRRRRLSDRGDPHSSLQLDMAGRIDDIASPRRPGRSAPADAIEAISAARHLRPRFGTPRRSSDGRHHSRFRHGHQSDRAALPGYLFLGLVVGAIVAPSRLPSLTPILPTLSALVVTVWAIWFVDATANDGLLE